MDFAGYGDAGTGGDAIDENSTNAAIAFATTNFRASQAQAIAQEIAQFLTRDLFERIMGAVDSEFQHGSKKIILKSGRYQAKAQAVCPRKASRDRRWIRDR